MHDCGVVANDLCHAVGKVFVGGWDGWCVWVVLVLKSGVLAEFRCGGNKNDGASDLKICACTQHLIKIDIQVPVSDIFLP